MRLNSNTASHAQFGSFPEGNFNGGLQKTKNIYVQAFSKDVPEAAAEALLVAVNR